MEQQKLKDYIEELSVYLGHMNASEQEKEGLKVLIENIQSQLDVPASEAVHVETLADQVDELASVFEAEHPTLTAVLNNVMVTLTSMGV